MKPVIVFWTLCGMCCFAMMSLFSMETVGVHCRFEPTEYQVSSTSTISYLGRNLKQNDSLYTGQKTESEVRVLVRHIAFIKVHKAAGTTVQNIFLRYGYEKDLVFALPMYGSTISIRKFVTRHNVLPPPTNKSFDILCSHVRFSRESFSKILPNDSKYIGIVREPFRQFQSNLQYYRQRYVVNIPGNKPVLEYLLHNKRYMKFGGKIPSTYNRMSYDFGVPDNLFWSKDPDAIQTYLMKLDTDIDLVIVMEYFDESIVLMRRLLNWDLKYVLYGKLNEKKKKDPRLQIGPTEEKLYRNWAHLDYALYRYFVKKLQVKINNQPQDFHDEVAYFRTIRIKYNEFCMSAITDKCKRSMLFNGSIWNKPFIVSTKDCVMLYKEEIPFLDKLREKQKELDADHYSLMFDSMFAHL